MEWERIVLFGTKRPSNTQETIDDRFAEFAGGTTGHHTTLLHGVKPISLTNKVQVLLQPSCSTVTRALRSRMKSMSFSVVEGQLRPEWGLVDLLRACWSGGSITGAPKVRACRRLHELEPVPRGPYGGSLFWLAPDGRFDSSILIRSLMVRDRRLRLHAGGGIVADSDPGDEAQTMGWKLLPLLEALA